MIKLALFKKADSSHRLLYNLPCCKVTFLLLLITMDNILTLTFQHPQAAAIFPPLLFSRLNKANRFRSTVFFHFSGFSGLSLVFI